MHIHAYGETPQPPPPTSPPAASTSMAVVRGVVAGQPYRRYTDDDRALLVELAVRQGYIAPVLWGGTGVSLTAAVFGGAALWRLWGGPLPPEAVVYLLVTLMFGGVLGGLAGFIIGGATTLVRMGERRRRLKGAGLEMTSSLKLLRRVSWVLTKRAPKTWASRLWARLRRRQELPPSLRAQAEAELQRLL